MKFKGYSCSDGSYLVFSIEDGDNYNSIGDQVWISPDGNTMEVSENLSKSLVREVMELFESPICAANFIESFMENR
jgi:hypothetical protein